MANIYNREFPERIVILSEEAYRDQFKFRLSPKDIAKIQMEFQKTEREFQFKNYANIIPYQFIKTHKVLQMVHQDIRDKKYQYVPKAKRASDITKIFSLLQRKDYQDGSHIHMGPYSATMQRIGSTYTIQIAKRESEKPILDIQANTKDFTIHINVCLPSFDGNVYEYFKAMDAIYTTFKDGNIPNKPKWKITTNETDNESYRNLIHHRIISTINESRAEFRRSLHLLIEDILRDIWLDNILKFPTDSNRS